MAKNDEKVTATSAAEVAGMSDERFAQWLRMEAVKVAEASGRVHGKMIDLVLPDAEKVVKYCQSGALPPLPKV